MRNLLIAVIIVFARTIFSQNDIGIQPTLSPPHTPFLSDFVNKPNKIMVILTNNTGSPQSIKLQVKLTSDNGVKVTSNPNYKPSQPIQLNPGQSKTFTSANTELKNYFSTSSLFIQGISKNDLAQTDVLPEGDYEICLRAFDYTTNQPLSEEAPMGCVNFSISYLDPPMIIAPQCKEDVEAKAPQNILFSWSPPSSAPTGLNYRFVLKELPNKINPNDVIKSASFPEIHKEENLKSNSLVYSAAKPKLVEGKSYVWRVQAYQQGQSTAYFKQDGYSEACVFTYKSSKPINEIGLIAPANKSNISWNEESNNGIPAHYKFTYNKAANKQLSYEVQIYKMNTGQTPEQAINNPLAIIDEKPTTANNTYYCKYKLAPGNYAWRVVGTGFTNNDNNTQSDVWSFTVPVGDTSTIKEFSICNNKIIVTKIIKNNLNDFAGEGYYTYNLAKKKIYKAEVKFNSLKLGHTKIEQGRKTDWKCYSGKVYGTFKDAVRTLEPQGDLEGSFNYNMKTIDFEANIQPHFDATNNVYKIEEGDKGEGHKVNLFAELEWISPIQIKEGSTYGGGPIPMNNGNGPFGNLNLFRRKISAMENEGFEFKAETKLILSNPENTILKLNKGCKLMVQGEKVSANFSGEFSVYSGTTINWPVQGYQIYHDFDFSYVTGLNFSGNAKGGKPFKITWDKNGKVKSEIHSAILRLSSQKPMMGSQEISTSKRGVFIYPNFSIEYAPKKYKDVELSYMLNQGKGYEMSKTKPMDIAISSFKAKTDKLKIQIYESKLAVFDIKGSIQVPFVNMQAPFSLWADYENSPQFNINFDLSETTVINNSAQKVTVTPITAKMVNDECISMEGVFNFIDKTNGVSSSNGQTFSASDVYMKDILIYSDGTVKKNFISNFQWQPSGFYNGFDFKLKKYQPRTENGKVIFKIWGDIVLEESTLAPKDPLVVQIGMNLPKGEIDTNYNPFYLDESKDLMACNTEPSYSEYEAPDGPSGNNSLEISSSGVKASYCDKSTVCFDATFEYMNNAIYGKGFHAEVNAQLYQPMQGSIFLKVMVGKAPQGYKYWFLEAAQKDFIEFATGVLDLYVYGFGGRLYYHMYHKPGEKNIDKSDYIPNSDVGFGVYALLNVKTKGSDGRVLWGNVSTEITTTSDWGLLPIKIHGDAWLLSGGVNDKDAKIKGTADVEIAICSPQYLHGIITADVNYEDKIKANGTLDIHLGNDDWHVHLGTPQNPVIVVVPDLDLTINGHVMIDKLQGANFRIGAGVNGSLFDFDKSITKCIGVWRLKCCFSAGAHFKLAGAISAEAYIPSFQLNGKVSVNASAGVHASACGIGLAPNLNATFNGSFMVPSPFCIAGSLHLSTPSPLPDFDVSARFKSGDGISLKGDCN